MLYLVDSDDVVMKGTRAYFQTTSSEAKPVLTLGFDGATGMDAIEHGVLRDPDKESVYDLTGRRVPVTASGRPVHSGLYVVNGKKWFIK